MGTIVAFFGGIGGLAVGAVVIAFLVGWLLLRRNARRLKETT